MTEIWLKISKYAKMSNIMPILPMYSNERCILLLVIGKYLVGKNIRGWTPSPKSPNNLTPPKYMACTVFRDLKSLEVTELQRSCESNYIEGLLTVLLRTIGEQQRYSLIRIRLWFSQLNNSCAYRW